MGLLSEGNNTSKGDDLIIYVEIATVYPNSLKKKK